MQKKFRNGMFVVFFLIFAAMNNGVIQADVGSEDKMAERMAALEQLVQQLQISHKSEIKKME
ncbi:MAG: hypothetical protein KKH94_04155 [Candidatus Omnitrophica bacterium]|nr:hypothetical protein [Candidatus Omnitrophota bacterium]